MKIFKNQAEAIAACHAAAALHGVSYAAYLELRDGYCVELFDKFGQCAGYVE